MWVQVVLVTYSLIPRLPHHTAGKLASTLGIATWSAIDYTCSSTVLGQMLHDKLKVL